MKMHWGGGGGGNLLSNLAFPLAHRLDFGLLLIELMDLLQDGTYYITL